MIEEEKKPPAKGQKGKKEAIHEEPELRMITPDPLLMTNENGRLFEFELGKYEKIKKE